MKGFIELHHKCDNELFMLNVNLISYIGYTGNIIMLHEDSCCCYYVKETYEEIVNKIKQAMEEEIWR